MNEQTSHDRAQQGMTNYQNGLSAEGSVERVYEDAGFRVLERRWRGASGEVDLILQKDLLLAFVEVKRSKDFASSATRLSASQIGRVCLTAEEYIASKNYCSMDIRIDAALVNCRGEIQSLENVTL